MSVTATNLFGRLVDGEDVETALSLTLEMWLPDYTAQIERKKGYAPHAMGKPDVIPRSSFDKFSEEMVPCIIVADSGLAEPPVRKKQGTYDAKWLMTLAPIVSDFDQPATRKLALAWAALIRLAVGQHKMLKSDLYPTGFANGSWWRDEQYTILNSEMERTLGAATVVFAIGVDDVMTEYAGPRTPSDDPYIDPGNWPAMADGSPSATVTPIGIEDPLP